MSDAAERSRFLIQLASSHDGAVRFDHWMASALYDPRFGYYSSSLRDIGARGDFSTWPSMDGALARALARWAKNHRPPRGAWNLIEAGGGSGRLAFETRKALGWIRAPRLFLVETSPRLTLLQQRLLGRGPRWFRNPAEALRSAGGQALIYSNELADAFPCRVFQKTDFGWNELHLGLQNGRVQEIWRSADRLPDSTAFSHSWPSGQRVEVQAGFREWMEELSSEWTGGRMLVIDYGALCPDLYFRRPNGSLRAYARHQRFEGADVFHGFGRRDITADVNFSDLLRWASQLGWRAGECLPLREFLKDVHPPERLLLPDGPADAFRAVEFQPAE